MNFFDETIQSALRPLYGKNCCRARVGRMRSLDLGFGEKVFHGKPHLLDAYYGEWEIGTFNSAWRVLKDNTVVIGSTDAADNIEELNARVNRIEFGSLVQIEQRSKLDVRIVLHPGVIVDFLCTSSEDDECLHIFLPNGMVVEQRGDGQWMIVPATRSW